LVANGGNGDGAITSLDAVWADLVMWQDANSDGVSQTGELLTLGSLGITSIDVSNYELEDFNGLASGTPFGRIIQGNTVTHTGSFTMNGNVYEVVDVWYDSDLANTSYVGDYIIDPLAWILPNIRGYGMVANLDIAMSQNEDLLDDVSDFVTGNGFGELFDGTAGSIENIMLAWAGLDPDDLPDFGYSKHGMFEELKEFWFLRRFTGQDHDGLGTWFDQSPYLPYVDEGVLAIRESYANLLNAFSSRLIFQSGGAALFEEGVTYNPFTDEFEGTFALSEDAVGDLETAAGTAGDLMEYWRAVAKFIDDTMGLSELSGTELGWLDDAVDASSSSAFDWADVVATLSTQSIYGTNGSDTVNGTDHNDIVNGHAQGAETSDTSADTLNGGAGDDILYASTYATDDTLNGGLGNDILYGGAGNDTYIYDYGHDVIVEQSPASYTDVIQLASGISVSDVTLHLSRMDATQPHFFLEIEGRGTLTIRTQIGVAAQTLIDQIQFSGGPTWYFTSSAVYFHGTNDDDSFSTAGFEGDSFYYGYGGNDILQGQSGDDVLDGGDGDDDLRGGDGDDTYIVSAGNDIVRESSGTDKIIVPDGYTLDDVSVYRLEAGGNGESTDEIRIEVAGLGSLTVLNFFATNTTGYRVESLEVSGESPINLLTHVYTTIGTSGNDFFYGTPSSWVQTDDIYLFGTGNDQVYEATGFDTLLFGEGIAPEDITVNRVAGNSFTNLRFSDAFGNSITFNSHFGNSATTTALEQVKFADDTTWTIANMEIEALGTENADTIFAYDWGDASTKDIIYGLGGNDQIDGGSGDDELHGGDGNDSLMGGDGNDILWGDDGNDFLWGDGGADILIGGAGDDTINGGTGDDLLEGGAGDDILNGGGAAGGVDTVTYANAASGVTANLNTGSASDGDGGTDTLQYIENITGSEYGDTITGNGLDNVLRGLEGNDTISGDWGNDILYGDAGADTLSGGNGSDILYGGTGADTLTGGNSADTFVFEGTDASDTITDFSTAQNDKLDVSDILEGYNPLTDLISDFVRITDNGTNSYLSVDVDGGANNFVQIATLSGVTNIAAGATATENELQTLITNGNLLAA